MSQRSAARRLVSRRLSDPLAPRVSAIHAYDVATTLTYVKNGDILPHYEE
ncbi:hypothetical protein [Streptomyces violarus]|nr:hypothetical protein [Streptomyces violarus]MCT9137668.1 hypothetical protein [Streptomyces violarus]